MSPWSANLEALAIVTRLRVGLAVRPLPASVKILGSTPSSWRILRRGPQVRM
jgi:hypothetical protein